MTNKTKIAGLVGLGLALAGISLGLHAIPKAEKKADLEGEVNGSYYKVNFDRFNTRGDIFALRRGAFTSTIEVKCKDGTILKYYDDEIYAKPARWISVYKPGKEGYIRKDYQVGDLLDVIEIKNPDGTRKEIRWTDFFDKYENDPNYSLIAEASEQAKTAVKTLAKRTEEEYHKNISQDIKTIKRE